MSGFKYVRFPPNGKDPKFRPMIKISMTEKSVLPLDALVDSGSDITLSYEEIGRGLGIDFDNPACKKKVEEEHALPFNDQVFGLNNEPIEVFIHPISMNIHGKQDVFVIRWIRAKMDAENTDFPVILGQDSIFSLFDIHFSKRQNKFFLNEKILSD